MLALRLGVSSFALARALLVAAIASVSAFYDFKNDVATVNGVAQANSTANLTVSRASIGYDLAATTQFAANVARRTGAGLLVEAAATNPWIYSRDLTNATQYPMTSMTVANTAPTADGAATASRLTMTAGSPTFTRWGRSASLGSTTNTIWSFYYRSNSSVRYIHFRVARGSNYVGLFDTQTNSYLGVGYFDGANLGTAPTSGAVYPAGNGWYKAVVVVSAGASSSSPFSYFSKSATTTASTWAGGGAEYIDIDHVQLEDGPTFSSSAIDTTTSAATRAADNITLPIPAGADTLIYTFDDGSQQYVTVSPGTYTIPTNLRRSVITSIRITSALAFYDFQNDTARSAGSALASSTSGLTVSRASIGYDLAATTQFAANVARRTAAGLLVEAAATNIVPFSKPAAGGWGSTASGTLTENVATAPDGTNTFGRVTSAAGSVSGIRANVTYAINTTYVLSFHTRPGTQGSWLLARLLGVSSPNQWFNTATGVVGNAQTGLTRGVINLGNGVSRFWVSGTTGASISNNLLDLDMTVGDSNGSSAAGDNALVWGVQVEPGSFPSSYVPTATTAAATRAADNITLTLPTGVTKVDLVYDNGSTVTVAASAGSYTVPNNSPGATLKSLMAY